MTYTLTHNGRPLETHPTRIACVIAAFERKLVVTYGRTTSLVRGAEIKETE